jgi:hypothetical protein
MTCLIMKNPKGGPMTFEEWKANLLTPGYEANVKTLFLDWTEDHLKLTGDLAKCEAQRQAALVALGAVPATVVAVQEPPKALMPPVDLSDGSHGHVWARPDGRSAPCGGPAVCATCKNEQIALNNMRSWAKEPIA